MARPLGDPTELIRRLEAAKKVAARSDVVSADLMAKIAGMTWRNLLVTHIEPDPRFPIQLRGAEGVAWEFRVTKVLAHMIKRAKERVEVKQARIRREAGLTGFIVPDEPGSENSLSIDRLDKLVKIAASIRKEKEASAGTMDKDSSVRDFIDFLQTIQSAVLDVAQEVDPTGSFEPEVRISVENACRNMLVKMHEAGQRWIEKRR